jgi:hypothetical protein
LHHPRTVDDVLSLAETQEEMMEKFRPYSSTSRFKHAYNSSYSKTGFPVKGILSHKTEDKEQAEHKPHWESKFQSLNAQRRARGECFKCGDKFQPGHKCRSSTISERVVGNIAAKKRNLVKAVVMNL